MPDQVAGESAARPVYMKMVRDGDGEIRWGRILVMLAVTVLSGYLATKSQRAGGRIDFETELKMRAALAGQKTGSALCRAGCAISVASAKAYDRARPV